MQQEVERALTELWMDGLGQVNSYRFCHTDTIDAVAALVLNCRVLPPVQVDHVIGSSERQAKPGGLGAKDQHIKS